MSSSKRLNEDVKEALSNRKLGSLRTALKKTRKMHKYAKTDAGETIPITGENLLYKKSMESNNFLSQ